MQLPGRFQLGYCPKHRLRSFRFLHQNCKRLPDRWQGVVSASTSVRVLELELGLELDLDLELDLELALGSELASQAGYSYRFESPSGSRRGCRCARRR